VAAVISQKQVVVILFSFQETLLSALKLPLPCLKVPRKLLRKEHIMKNLVDKPYKTGIYVVSVLLLGMTMFKDDVSNFKSINISSPVAKILEQKDKANDKLVVVETPVEETVIKPQKKKEVPLSRGGSIPTKTPKQLSEHETIVKYIREISSKYGMDPELIMSVVQQESRYNPKAKNGNCLGLMQVSTRWHKDRAKRLGVKDFYDSYGNILLGVDYLSELLKQYKDIRLVLMMYNMSHDTALKIYRNGQISTYAKIILTRAEEYKKGE
jgi:hypothetical protein